ncbi:MAG: hypothetical protein IIA61_10400 [Candidatus Marinimicrobia bacterium]|nr:hypothetical protein [Candidatus Neomarinimicrobiota bacterium]
MLAISIKNNQVRFAQADVSGHSIIINQLQVFPLPENLTTSVKNENDLKVAFDSLFQSINDSLSVPDREIYLSLGKNWIETDILFVDRDLTDREKEEFLMWTLRLRYGNIRDDLVPFFQNISGNNDLQVFQCVIQKNVLESIKEAVYGIGSIPVWMEPSVQSSIRAIAGCCDTLDSQAVLIEPEGRHFLGRILINDELQSMAIISVKDEKMMLSQIKGNKENMSQFLQIFNFVREDKEKKEFSIFLIGEFSDIQLNKWINRIETNKIQIVDPYRMMESKTVLFPDSSNGSWDVDILGLLLRRGNHA